jgi:Proteins containing SET domain
MASVEIRSSPHGKGVFALKKFRKGERILNFRGKIYSNQDKPRGLNAPRNHFLQIGIDRFMGPSRGPDNFVNHSCSPNAGIKMNGDEVVLVAIFELQAGQEITFDYSTTMVQDEWSMACACQSRDCRKKIEEYPRLPRAIRRRYEALKVVPDFVLNSK